MFNRVKKEKQPLENTLLFVVVASESSLLVEHIQTEFDELLETIFNLPSNEPLSRIGHHPKVQK